MKKTIALVLLATILVMVFTGTFAESIQPRYSHVALISAGLDINGGVAKCRGVGCSEFDDTYNYLYVRLQRCPQNGGNWGPVASWMVQTTGLDMAAISENITVEKGYDYRVYVNLQIKDETGYILDSVGIYSDVKSYHTTP